jgi:hypothetical protein
MLAVKSLNTLPSSFDSFEETYKNAYSHGLEHIYALETVDPKTVKKIEQPSAAPLECKDEIGREELDLWDGQLQLEFGDEFRGWIPPLFLKEPVQMLGLSQRAEAVCLEQGIAKVVDLTSVDFNSWVLVKGVGQGHVDEINQKLKQYINGRSIERSYFIEFGSLVRSLTVGLERKKAFILLESFGLEALLPLSPFERMESLNLQAQAKTVWIQECLQNFRSPERVAVVRGMLDQITKVFLSPWIRQRGGVVHLRELHERVERLAEDPSLVSKVMEFLQEVYAMTGYPLAYALVEVDHALFCPDAFTAMAYERICQKAKSYFYQPSVFYKLSELNGLLVREFGERWEGFPEKLAVLSLKRNPQFRVRKGSSGELEVRLA